MDTVYESREEHYHKAPRDFAMMLLEEGHSAEFLLLCMLKAMGHDEIRDALDANELSPCFDEGEDE